GAGHGIYCYFSARDASRSVVAVEPDLRKTVHRYHAPGVRWVAGYDDSVRGAFDAIVLYDATYRMSIPYRTALYRRVFERLRPGGTFVLKDMDPEHELKFGWAKAQEWLSDHVLKISIGSGVIHQTRAEVDALLRELGFEDVRARAIDRGYPHPHILYTARKPLSSR
ncbi:MAG TPA: class I SAM-dependent methyltransferase, partial [Vicinamibacterales bacterium]|nr:class I SAM-dependent methyltransferase [Vicinamibacterales bacterium]